MWEWSGVEEGEGVAPAEMGSCDHGVSKVGLGIGKLANMNLALSSQVVGCNAFLLDSNSL